MAGYRSRKPLMMAACLAAALLILIGLMQNSTSGKSKETTLHSAVIPATGDTNWRPWLQASKVKVSAVVFYGRRRYARVLDKYIKQNLIPSGGILEEVQAMTVVRTCPV